MITKLTLQTIPAALAVGAAALALAACGSSASSPPAHQGTPAASAPADTAVAILIKDGYTGAIGNFDPLSSAHAHGSDGGYMKTLFDGNGVLGYKGNDEELVVKLTPQGRALYTPAEVKGMNDGSMGPGVKTRVDGPFLITSGPNQAFNVIPYN
jgi:hypothetical protein